MMTYVALLRGINVGGNNIIKMADLRATFEKLGFVSVQTYIQSGNVIFQSPESDARIIEKKLETALSKEYNYSARVLIRTKAQMEATVRHFPKFFADETWKHNVIFLSHVLDHPDVVEKFVIKPELEKLSYAPGVLYWSASLADLTRSTMIKLVSRKEYQEMTVRNVNTTRKILERISKT